MAYKYTPFPFKEVKSEGKSKGKAVAHAASSGIADSDDESDSDSSDKNEVKANFTRLRVFISAHLTNESIHHVFIDSGASRHISPVLAMFNPKTIKTLNSHVPISTADGNIVYATSEGTLMFDLKHSGKIECGCFEHTLYAPDLSTTLISVSQLTYNGKNVSFGGDHCTITDHKSRVIGHAHHTRNFT